MISLPDLSEGLKISKEPLLGVLVHILCPKSPYITCCDAEFTTVEQHQPPPLPDTRHGFLTSGGGGLVLTLITVNGSESPFLRLPDSLSSLCKAKVCRHIPLTYCRQTGSLKTQNATTYQADTEPVLWADFYNSSLVKQEGIFSVNKNLDFLHRYKQPELQISIRSSTHQLT